MQSNPLWLRLKPCCADAGAAAALFGGIPVELEIGYG